MAMVSVSPNTRAVGRCSLPPKKKRVTPRRFHTPVLSRLAHAVVAVILTVGAFILFSGGTSFFSQTRPEVYDIGHQQSVDPAGFAFHGAFFLGAICLLGAGYSARKFFTTLGSHYIELNDDAFVQVNGKETAIIPWDTVRDVCDSPTMLVLIANNGQRTEIAREYSDFDELTSMAVALGRKD